MLVYHGVYDSALKYGVCLLLLIFFLLMSDLPQGVGFRATTSDVNIIDVCD